MKTRIKLYNLQLAGRNLITRMEGIKGTSVFDFQCTL
uniref:Uncharacterized protein n=1 Tax=Rhizophora mucronata TaxID=61149 RepID=A0A2P2PA95_RHIMU